MGKGLGENFNPDTFRKFEIAETRISKYIKSKSEGNTNIRIVALPTNAGLGKQSNYRIYSTYVFPTWKVCYGRRGGHAPILYNGSKCPLCETNDESSAVRFVAACSDGHLDEVNWNYAVHKNSSCKPEYFHWKANGSSLEDIVIECPICKSRNNMKEIYKMNFFCTGRTPERESPSSDYFPIYTKPDRSKNCDKLMKIMQRQSTSLRVPETMTLLTIPEFDTQISRILQRSDVSIALDTMINMPSDILPRMDTDTVINLISGSLKGRVPENSLEVINKEIKEKGVSEFCDLYKRLNDENKSFMSLMYEEFDSLLSGAGSSTKNFVMGHPKKIISDSHLIPELLVHPISKIRTITVQLGYKRMVSTTDENELQLLVSSGVYLPSDGSIWYPGYEGFGEGIFITFSERKMPDLTSKPAYNLWKEYIASGMTFDSEWSEVSAEPEFVWLHTFSHAVIRALSSHTGYSTASLRERVYISRDGKNGGILIYNTSPGEDGGMGGLVGSVDIFHEIITKALKNVSFCSNDPLCYDVTKSAECVNGSACYSCLLISETSCEHRNLWLDRHLLIGD
ncbi:MAG TPA: DUF1998 domain-containing protein [Methanosarcina sp.]|nr:DUF1998 domain-containing protein [Methanosarcina sp.]